MVASLLLLTGCAGMQRSCTSYEAERLGADWIVVKYDNSMRPALCWRLTDESLANEGNSDGIQWVDSATGDLVRIAGFYGVVAVHGGDFAGAAHLLGVDPMACGDGKYGVVQIPGSVP